MKTARLVHRIAISAIIFLISVQAYTQQYSAGINTETPNPNAVLHLVSGADGKQGLLIPVMTGTERTNMPLTSADNGLLVYDSEDQSFYYWHDGWIKLRNSSDIDEVNDADADPNNEIQDLAKVLTEGNDAGGNTISNVANPTSPQDVATMAYVDNKSIDDADADAGNELISGGTLTGTDLEISDAGGTTIIDLSSLIDDADPDPLNEIQSLGQVLGEGNDAGGRLIVNAANPIDPQDVATKDYVDAQTGNQDLGSVLGLGNDAGSNAIVNVADPIDPQDVATKNYVDGLPVDDADADPNNEIELPIQAALDAGSFLQADGSGGVSYAPEADGDPTNELQNLSEILGIGNDAGGNSIINVSDPTDPQDVATKSYVDGKAVDDADPDATNELQNISEVLTVGNDAGGQAIANVADPTAAQEVATKNYVDTQADNQNASQVPVAPVGNLTSGDVQAALVELQGDIDADAGGDMLESVYDVGGDGVVDDAELVNGLTVQTAVPAGALFTDNQAAGAVSVTPVGNLTSGDVQAALVELQGDIDADAGGDMLESVYDVGGDGVVDDAELVNGLTVLTAVPAGALFTDNQAAGAVAVTPVGNLTSGDVQAALVELQGDIDADAGGDMLESVYDVGGDGVVDDAELVNGLTVQTAVPAGALFTDNQAAGAVAVTPVGNLTSGDVQAALVELQGDIDADAGGDMLESVYDVGGDGVVDDAELVNGLTVQTAVPAGALFTDNQAAGAVAVTPVGNLTSGDVQAALVELQGDIDSDAGGDMLESVYDVGGDGVVDDAELVNGLTVQTAVPAGALFTDNQAAGAVAVTPVGNLTSGDVQAALVELQGDIDADAGGDMLESVYDVGGDGVVDDAELVNGLTVQTAVPAGALFTDNQAAGAVAVTPVGNLTSGDVQAALVELQGDIDSDAGGDMLESVYDVGGDGVVDDAELVNGLTVQTAVPAGALFTDNQAAGAVAVTPVGNLTSGDVQAALVELQGDIDADAGGDMLESVYDVGGDGVVDDAELVNGLTVQTAVPAAADFTDDQNISISGNGVSIDNGTGFSLAFNAPAADGDLLTWDNGNSRWDALAPPPPSFLMGSAEDASSIAFGSSTLVAAPTSKIIQVIDNDNNSGGAFLAAATYNTTDLTTSKSTLALLGARGTQGGESPIGTDDVIGEILFNGWDGSNFNQGAFIQGIATQNWGANTGTELSFGTAPNTGGGATQRLLITDIGAVHTTGGDFVIEGDGANARSIVFTEGDPTSGEVLGFKAPDDILNTPVIWTLPDGDGLEAAINSGDILGAFGFAGFDGSDFQNGAAITATALDNFNTNLGTSLEFSVTPAGTSALESRAILDETGLILLESAGNSTAFSIQSGGTVNAASITVPNSLAAPYTLELPVDDGLAGQVLSTNGTGILSWVNNGSGFTSTYNDDGDNLTFGGSGGPAVTESSPNYQLGAVAPNGLAVLSASSYGVGSEVRLSRANGSQGGELLVQNGEVIGEIAYIGFESGGSYPLGAAVRASANENWTSTTNTGTSLSFYATPSGTGTPVAMMNLGDDILSLSGDLELANGVARKVSVADNTGGGGDNLDISAGSSTGGGGNGGILNLRSGNGNGAGNGGNIRLEPGTGTINGSIDMRGVTRFGQTGALPGAIELEDNGGASAVRIQADGSSGAYTLTLPPAQGLTGQTLINSNGAGTLIWQDPDFTVDGSVNYQSISGTLASLTSGTENILIGTSAGIGLTAGESNVILGNGAGAGVTGAFDNVLLGRGANSTGGNENIAMGRLSSSSGGFSIAIGRFSVGDLNGVALGAQAEARSAGSVALGQVATVGTGSDNSIAIGNSANVPAGVLDAVAIGGSVTANVDNTIILGDGAPVYSVGIGTSAPATTLDVNGTVNSSGDLTVGPSAEVQLTSGGNINVAGNINANGGSVSASTLEISSSTVIDGSSNFTGSSVDVGTGSTVLASTGDITSVGHLTNTPSGPLSGASINPVSRVVVVNGGPNIQTINNGVAGRELILIATAVTTIAHGSGNIILNGSTNFVMNANATLHLIYNGTNWLEVGRSQP